MKSKLVSAAVALMCSPAIALTAPAITIERKTDSISEKDVVRAIEAFREACQPLGGEYWSDVTSVSAEAFEEYASFRMDMGWKTTIHLAIKFSDSPQFIPKTYDDIGVTIGHTLHYDIGSGSKPGFFASKRVSQRLCGIAVDDNGNDVFKDAPAFSFLKS